jgi:hypothetical protein
MKEVLSEFIGIPETSGWWKFCELIRENITAHLTDVSNVCSSDSSYSALNLSLLDYLISKLENGVWELARQAESIKLKHQRGTLSNGEAALETQGYLRSFCKLYLHKLCLKLRNYHRDLRLNDIEKLKFLLVPYNVATYFKDERLRKRLDFGDKERIMQFLLDCALGKHLRNGPVISEEDTVHSPDDSRHTERTISDLSSSPGSSVPVSDFTSPERAHSTKSLVELDSATTVEKPVDSVLRQIDAYLSLSIDKGYLGKDHNVSFYNHFNNIEQRTKKFWVASQSGPLKDLAMAVLSAPGSNSYVERIFSRVKDITVERRASLRPRTVRDLVISKFSLDHSDEHREYVAERFLDRFGRREESLCEPVVTDPDDDLYATQENGDLSQLELFKDWSKIEREKLQHLSVIRKGQYFSDVDYDRIVGWLE